jgi:hypothetical protein
MRIALQICANPRSFKRTFEAYQKYLIEPLHPDVFIHTWRLHGHERPDVTTDGSCEEYLDLYKPQVGVIEDLYYDYQPLYTMVPNFTTRFRANELRKQYEKTHGVKYDVVIAHRADIVLTAPFKMEYAQMVEEDSIWVHHFYNGLPSDYFFYSSPKWMDVTSDCYKEFDMLKFFHPGSERLWMYKLYKDGFKYEWWRLFGLRHFNNPNPPYHLFSITNIR